MIHTTTLSDREVFDQAFLAVGETFGDMPLRDKVTELSAIVDILGYGDRFTTGDVTRQIIRRG